MCAHDVQIFEKWDGIGDVLEVGVEADSGAKSKPNGPLGTDRSFVTGRYSSGNCFPDSTVFSAHTISDVRGACFQETCCGYFELKKASKAVGEGCRMREASSACVLSIPGT